MSSVFGGDSDVGSDRKKYLVGTTNELHDGQMKEADIKVGDKAYKVLLSKVSGQYYATSHLCSHYKARLVTGVLTGGGRLVCPWHAACFNVRTGDIEEAPATQTLQTFQTMIEGENVFIMAEAADFLTPFRTACSQVVKGDPIDNRQIVIIGGGAAGAMAAESARATGFSGKIVLITREPHLPIDRIKLSKFLDVQVENLLLHRIDYLKQINIEYQVSEEVTAVDPTEKTITLTDGSSLRYDKLLIATGGEPRHLPIAGADLQNIFVIRHIEANEAILKAVRAIGKPKVVIIGASFIGMETAAMMVKVSESVTVVGLETVPMERVLGVEVGQVFQRLHEKNGVKFRLGTSIKAFTANAQDERKVAAIELGDGSILEADIVIVGVGIKLATEFADKALSLERDGGITVDSQLRIPAHKDIYAAGDIANFPYGTSNIRVEHWDVASQQGRIAGHNMGASLTGSACKPYDSVPFFFSLQFGKSIRYAGSTHAGYDEIWIDGDPTAETALSFAAYYLREDKVLAVATMGRDPLTVHCSELMRLNRMPSASIIKAGKSPLEISLQ